MNMRLEPRMTHAELVTRAKRWLRNTIRCRIVVTEVGLLVEIPDAIGWKPDGRSWLVECKANREDFLRDQHKPSRQVSDIGLGFFRYYMAEPGTISPYELPEQWGLLEIHPKQVRVIKEAEPFLGRCTIGHWNELRLLISIAGKAIMDADTGE